MIFLLVYSHGLTCLNIYSAVTEIWFLWLNLGKLFGLLRNGKCGILFLFINHGQNNDEVLKRYFQYLSRLTRVIFVRAIGVVLGSFGFNVFLY